MTNGTNLRIFSAVPSGLVMERPVPGVKTQRYYRMALRDWKQMKEDRILHQSALTRFRIAIGLAAEGRQSEIAVAKRLRNETTMTLKWIAQRLQMGSWTYVFNLLAANRRRKEP